MGTTNSLVGNTSISVWPRLSYHYGFSFVELAAMPRWALMLYLDELPALLAEQQLAAIEAAAYPHMEKRSQSSTTKRLAKMMNGGRREAATKIDVVGDGGGNPLAGMIGVEIVDDDDSQ